MSNGKGDKRRSGENTSKFREGFDKIFTPTLEKKMVTKLRPSGSSRWLKCKGSVLLELDAPVVSSIDKMRAAAHGSAAHELLETCLNTGDHPNKYLGTSITIDDESQTYPMSFVVDEEMADAIQFFLDASMYDGEWPDGEGTMYSELGMTHSKVPALEGTADYVLVNGNKAFLRDLKFGTGTVIAQNRKGEINTQLMSYASLIFDKFEAVDTIYASLVQPRCKTIKKIREVTITRQQSDVYMDSVEFVSDFVENASGEEVLESLVEGGHCWFCDAAKICPLKKENQAMRDFM